MFNIIKFNAVIHTPEAQQVRLKNVSIRLLLFGVFGITVRLKTLLVVHIFFSSHLVFCANLCACWTCSKWSSSGLVVRYMKAIRGALLNSQCFLASS